MNTTGQSQFSCPHTCLHKLVAVLWKACALLHVHSTIIAHKICQTTHTMLPLEAYIVSHAGLGLSQVECTPGLMQT
jgi:hypothetical protein